MFILWVAVAGYFDPTVLPLTFLGYFMGLLDSKYNEGRVYEMIVGLFRL